MVQENCYVLHDETQEGVIIDCGALMPEEEEALRDYIAAEGIQVKHLLHTHSHFDHVFGDQFVYSTYGIKPEMHEQEVALYGDVSGQVAMFLHRNISVVVPPLGNVFTGRDEIKFGNHTLEIIETPGHSPGGVCFYCRAEKALFSGDSLFKHEIGRFDFPYGDGAALIDNLKTKILTLPADVNVYPGHGDATSIEEERAYNPYLR